MHSPEVSALLSLPMTWFHVRQFIKDVLTLPDHGVIVDAQQTIR
jgi:hypothetical protein